MIINQIEFENFRPYRGSFCVDISSSPDKNVTLIHGENGQGKTSFFTGLNWCLYGDSSIARTGLGEKELINKGMLYDANVGDRIITSVSIKFTRNGNQYIVYRSKTVAKKGKSKALDYTVIDTDFYIQDLAAGVKKRYGEEAQEILNSILPENVRTYFFFDGEHINAFAEAKPEEIGLAVRNILKLDLITRAKEHLSTVAKELNQDAKPHISYEQQTLLDQKEELQRQRDLKIDQKEKYKKQLEACRKLKNELESELANMKEIESQMHRRKALEDQLEQLKSQNKQVAYNLKQVLSKSYRTIAHSAFLNAKSILNKSSQNDGQNSKAVIQVAKKIYEKNHCLFCDRPLEKEDKSRLETLIFTEKSSRFDFSDLQTLSTDLDDSIHNQRRTFRDLINLYNTYSNAIDSIDKIKMEIKRIDDEVSQSPLDSIQLLSQKRDKCIQDEVRLELEIENSNDEIEKLRIFLSNLTEKIKHSDALASEAQQKIEQSSLAESCIQELEMIYEKFADEMRAKIQEETTEVFKSLLLKKQQFQKIELDEQYVLSLYDRFGDKNSRIDISAAESQILGLSFILGLSRVSECGAPLVIDTPFGRFSERLKQNVLNKLPSLVPQLILFVTDSEIGDDEHSILNDWVQYEYTLINDDNNGQTTIYEGRKN